MAVNPLVEYGLDIACVSDADELFTEAEGLEIVAQDCLHLLLCDDFLGPDGDGLGYDCRRLIGLSTDELIGLQSVLVSVLEQDDRVLKATVLLTPIVSNGLADVFINATCETAAGPFSLTKSVLDLTSGDLEGDTQ